MHLETILLSEAVILVFHQNHDTVYPIFVQDSLRNTENVKKNQLYFAMLRKIIRIKTCLCVLDP